MNALKYVIFQSTNRYLPAWSFQLSSLSKYIQFLFNFFFFFFLNESGRAQLNSYEDLNLFVDRGHLVLSEPLRTPGCVTAFMWPVRIIRWFWRPWPAARIAGCLCIIDMPLWCCTERICLLILCCPVHSTELQSLRLHCLWCIFQQE